MSLVKQSVLCVDDNEDTLSMLSLILRQEGLEVTTAETVQDALNLSRVLSFDLYVLDSWFREESGIALCRQIRELDGESPIVVYSGAATLSDRAEALAAGATVFVPKPYIEELLEAVRKLREIIEA